jgi:hypothetical protein
MLALVKPGTIPDMTVHGSVLSHVSSRQSPLMIDGNSVTKALTIVSDATERRQAVKQETPCFRHTSFSFPLTKSSKRRSEPAQLRRARGVPAITLSSSIDGRRLGRRDVAEVAIEGRQNGVTSRQ